MRPSKKPKYPLDIKKINIEAIKKKEKDLTTEELYKETLRLKMKMRKR